MVCLHHTYTQTYNKNFFLLSNTKSFSIISILQTENLVKFIYNLTWVTINPLLDFILPLCVCVKNETEQHNKKKKSNQSLGFHISVLTILFFCIL